MVQPRKTGVFLCLLLSTLIACNKASEESFSKEEKDFYACLDRTKSQSQKREKALEASYKHVDPDSEKLRSIHKTLFLKGLYGKGAVLLFHGILSSPEGVRLLAEEFNKKGITVLAPLISGFGSSVKVANASSLLAWQQSVDLHAQILSPCFKSFALVGFSLGGALSTDFVLNRYPKLHLDNKVARINSLLLLSPAIRPSETFVPLKANSTLFVTDAVPFWLISKLKNDPDIKEMMQHPEKYNQHFPVYVGKGLYKLSKTLEESHHRFDLHPLPVSLDYSQADSATDWIETRSFLTDSFFDVRIFSYPKSELVPHSLYLREKNEIGDQIRGGLVRFVRYYSKNHLISD